MQDFEATNREAWDRRDTETRKAMAKLQATMDQDWETMVLVVQEMKILTGLISEDLALIHDTDVPSYANQRYFHRIAIRANEIRQNALALEELETRRLS